MSIVSLPHRSRQERPGLAQVANALFAGATQAWRARRANRAMSLLSDEILHDIGVSRSEIPDAVRHGRPARH